MQPAGLIADDYTYCAMVAAYSSGDQLQKAQQMIAEAHSKKLKLFLMTYNSALSAYGRAAQWQQAEQMFKEMQRIGVEPDVVVYNAMITAYGN
eukprot:15998-Heterococcus_DN1.PRE.2